MTNQPKENTDRELWRDDWQGTIFITERGGVGINVGGHVIVKPLRDWHKAFAEATAPPTPDEDDELVARLLDWAGNNSLVRVTYRAASRIAALKPKEQEE